jgi:putative effector of murein hydrolase LrgA (UPF0299 family)
MQEIENTADDGQWWQIIADWVEDLMDQSIPGSVVILILLVAVSGSLFKLIGAWLDRRATIKKRMRGE